MNFKPKNNEKEKRKIIVTLEMEIDDSEVQFLEPTLNKLVSKLKFSDLVAMEKITNNAIWFNSLLFTLRNKF